MLLVVAGLSVAVVPLLRARINKQFLLGARKPGLPHRIRRRDGDRESLQMEPRLEARYDEMLAQSCCRFSLRASSPTPTTSSPTRSSSP